MNIKEIQVKSIITKSNLPDSDFVINPYIGCQHACIYCYARFMKRFTRHEEPWGDFVDVKMNSPNLVSDLNKFRGKQITIGSVTDPYQPLEQKYSLTRKILERLIDLKPQLCILTKSDLVARDIDILKKFNHCLVAISFSSADEDMRRRLEPMATSVERKIEVLKKLNKVGIKTAVFISPIMPGITNWKRIIDLTRKYTDEFWFENLNLYPSIKGDILRFYNENGIEYDERNYRTEYLANLEKEIKAYCPDLKISIYFNHKSSREY